jgi:hypothetical protein
VSGYNLWDGWRGVDEAACPWPSTRIFHHQFLNLKVLPCRVDGSFQEDPRKKKSSRKKL